MRPLNLADDEHAALVDLMKQTIAFERFPLSPRGRTLQRVLDQLDPPAAKPQPYPAVKPSGERDDYERLRLALTQARENVIQGNRDQVTTEDTSALRTRAYQAWQELEAHLKNNGITPSK